MARDKLKKTTQADPALLAQVVAVVGGRAPSQQSAPTTPPSKEHRPSPERPVRPKPRDSALASVARVYERSTDTPLAHFTKKLNRKQEVRVVGVYVRYSMAMQKDDSSVRQNNNCTAYAKRVFPKAKIIPFRDLEKSGAYIEGRPDLEAMLSRGEAGEIQAVVVEDADRLSRDFFGMVAIFKKLIDAGVELHSAFEGRLLEERDIAHLAIRASEDRAAFLTRTQQAREKMAEEGRSPTGPCYGFEACLNGKNQRDQKIDDDLKPVLERMIAEVIEGKSDKEIAIGLNEDGILSPEGGKWTATSVGQIIRNRRYMGELTYLKTTIIKVPGHKTQVFKNPADKQITAFREDLVIIPRERWELANAIRSARGPSQTSGGAQDRFFVSRLMDCHECASTLQIRGNKDGKRLTGCSAHLGADACGNGAMFDLARIEAAVIKAVADQLNPTALGQLAVAYNEEQDRQSRVREARRTELERERQHYTDQLRDSLKKEFAKNIPDDIVEAQRQQWSDERSRTEDELQELGPPLAPVKLNKVELAKLKEQLLARVPGQPIKPEDVAGRQLLATFRRLVDKIHVLPENPDGSVPLRIEGRIAEVALGLPFGEAAQIEALCPPAPLACGYTSAELDEHAKRGTFKLTDAELGIIYPMLASCPAGRRGSTPNPEELAHYIFFVLRSHSAGLPRVEPTPLT